MRKNLLAAAALIMVLGISPALAEEVVYDELPLKYPWSGYMGSSGDTSLTVDPFSTEHPSSGDICANISYDGSEDWTGLYIQATGDWRRNRGVGLDLRGEEKLVFYAKGARGGENVSFGYGYDVPDASGLTDSAYASRPEQLSDSWTKYEFDLRRCDRSHINGLFRFYIEGDDNPDGAIFYLDNITYM